MPRFVGMGPRFAAPVLLAAMAALALLAAPAGATITTTFTLTPSTTQAGSNPNIATDTQISSPDDDDVRNATVSLAPGLLANPTAATTCTTAQFNAAPSACPASSQVGSGTVSIDSPFAASFDAKVFLLPAQSAAEAARAGLLIDPGGAEIKATAPVTLRTSPDVGLDIAFKDLPNTAPVVGDIRVSRMQLTLNGTAPGGGAFTRNPTACTPATSRLAATSWAGSTASASSAFTPTGCATLAYAPKLTGSATLDSSGDGATVTTEFSQGAGEAATRSAQVKLPPQLAPRLTKVAQACTASDPAACPASATVGSATVSSPILAQPLTGRAVLVKGTLFPNLVLVFPSPYPLRITGTTSLSASGLSATFAPIPDLPITNLRLKFDGGPSSLFKGPGACVGSPTLVGDFTAHSGKTAHVTAPLTVNGCRFTLGGSLSFLGLGGSNPRLSLSLRPPTVAASQSGVTTMQRVDVRLPRGLGISKRKLRRGLVVRADGKRVRRAGRAIRRGVRITLRGAGARRLRVTLRRGALRVSRRLAARVRRRRGGRLTVRLRVRVAGGHTARLRLRARAR